MKQAKWHKRVIRADKQEAPIGAAGVMVMHSGKVLLLKRSNEGDANGKWDFPGGGMEAGETPEQAAIRECQEECGFKPQGILTKIFQSDKHGADYTTFSAPHPEETKPKLNAEHSEFAWVPLDDLNKYDLHPGIAEMHGIEARADAADFESYYDTDPKTELDVARAIREGKIPSPQTYANVTLFDLRISGTGVSYRKSHKEFVFRSPDIYLTDEFLARCYGLPVIFEHPAKQALDSKEFSDRIVGTILLPYVKGTEVWGIAKIYDESAVQLMTERQMSTSPSVVFRDPKENEQIDLEDGKHLLIEGNPSLLDHLAIVDVGVWDKGGEPSGVKSSVHAETAETSRADSADRPDSLKGDSIMADVTSTEPVVKKDEGEAGGMGEVLALLKAISGRLDALEAAEAAEAAPAVAAKPDAVAAPSLPTPEQKPAAAAPVADNAVPSPEVAAMAKRVDALEAKTAPVPETEAAQMADCQAKADSAYAAHGGHAPRPMLGESGMDYRKRLVAGLQKHSKKGAEIKLSAIADSAMLDMVESIVYADALEAASQAVAIPAGVLMESVHVDDSGRRIKEYKGSPSAWLNQFSAPSRMLTRINREIH